LPFYVRDRRGTEDIDLFADVSEPELGARLRRAGFTHAPESRVIVRWRLGEESVDVIPRVPDLPRNRAVMTFWLTAEPGGTRLDLRHDLPEVVAIEPHSRFFWTVALDLLREEVEAPA
jgi:hypothetical protein